MSQSSSDEIRTFSFEEKSERLDKYLTQCLSEFSRSRIQSLIKDGKVLINGEAVTKTGYKLESGMKIQVSLPPVQDTELMAEDIPLNIIYEDNNLYVIDKPAGMVVHPAAGHQQGTLVNAILGHDPDIEGVGGEKRPGIVHRLDKETSGIILIAKNDYAHQWLQSQFKERKVKKFYLTLVEGHPATREGKISAPIGRDTSQRKRMAVVPTHKGREAKSVYRTLQVFENHTLLEVQIFTGRTHQIRVHMAFIKCPVVGDKVYGRRKQTIRLDRQFLHAARISICLPGEEQETTFESPLPPELQSVVDNLE